MIEARFCPQKISWTFYGRFSKELLRKNHFCYKNLFLRAEKARILSKGGYTVRDEIKK